MVLDFLLLESYFTGLILHDVSQRQMLAPRRIGVKRIYFEEHYIIYIYYFEELIPKRMQKGLRVITLQGAIEKSPILEK